MQRAAPAKREGPLLFLDALPPIHAAASSFFLRITTPRRLDGGKVLPAERGGYGRERNRRGDSDTTEKNRFLSDRQKDT